VRGGVVGTSVSHLHRNDQGIRASSEQRKTTGLAGLHGAAHADLGRRGIGSHARRTPSTCDGAAERLAGGEGAKRDRGEDCGDGGDHRAVRSTLRTQGPPTRPSDSGPIERDAVEKASSGAWATSPETDSPASRKHDEANGLNAGKRGFSS
jgi:hypothetical protein